MDYTKYEKELKQLQDEVRGVDVFALNDREFNEFSNKSRRIHELINILYDFKGVN